MLEVVTGVLANKIVMCDKVKASSIFSEALIKAGFKADQYDVVLVKSNICGMYHPELQLIEQTLRFFEPLAKRVVIGETDSMAHSPEEQFRRLGIRDMLKHFEKNVEAVNLMEDKILDIEVPSPNAIDHLPIPETVHNCDLLVNISKVGTHSRTMLTCAFKNLFGLLAEKHKYSVYHPLDVDKVIADLAKVVICDLNIVEAEDKVLVGLDPLPIDIFACRFVDLNPSKVEHLRIISQDRNLRLEDIVKQLQIIAM